MRAGLDRRAELKRLENLLGALVAALLRHLRSAYGRGPDAIAVDADVELLRLGSQTHDAAVGAALVQAQLELVVAVDRKVVLDRQPAARSPRQILAEAASLIAIGRHEERLGRRRAAHVAERDLADLRRRTQVPLGENRRQRQRVGVVVEPVSRVVGGQERRRVDLEPEQIADRVAVLHPVEAMQRRAAGIRVLGGRAIEVGLERRRHAVSGDLVGTRTSDRRHRARPHLADDFLQHLGVLAGLRQIDLVERETGGLEARVMTGDAVLVEHGSRRRRRLRRLRRLSRGLRRRAVHLDVVGERSDEARRRRDQREPSHRFFCSFSFLSSGIAAAHGGGHFISFAPSFRSSTAVCGWAANEFPYSTPSATMSGVRPSLATTSSFAPLSKRYWTTLFAPRYAAACIAVSPRSLIALTSAP